MSFAVLPFFYPNSRRGRFRFCALIKPEGSGAYHLPNTSGTKLYLVDGVAVGVGVDDAVGVGVRVAVGVGVGNAAMANGNSNWVFCAITSNCGFDG